MIGDEPAANEERKDLVLGEGPVDKTKFTKEAIMRSGTAGIRAREIIAAFEKAGVKVKRTYVYAILHRLKEGKKAKYRNGKYVLEKVTASE